MSRPLDDYLDGWHELQADIEERDADLRDAEFLAPKRLTTRPRPDVEDVIAEATGPLVLHTEAGPLPLPLRPVPLPHERYPALPFRSARCRSCYRTDCDGGMECVGSAAWD